MTTLTQFQPLLKKDDVDPDDKRDPNAASSDEDSSAAGRRGALFLWLACALLYFTLGAILDVRYNLTFGDGLSRVANGDYVIFSRDPHLAAVGFVWNPLPSLAEIPLIALKGIWPDLVARGLAGIIMSSVFMAGAVIQVRGILRDRCLSTAWVTGLTAAFALNPMIVLYGGNAMSEAPFVFFTAWAVRRLLRWVHSHTSGDLFLAGLATGLSYLTRYEASVVAAGAAVLVGAITFDRLRGSSREYRYRSSLLDMVMFAIPPGVAFGAWTLASWIITGSGLAQFSSVYGNSSQVSIAQLGSNGGFENINFAVGGPIQLALRDLLTLEPLLPVILGIALVLVVWRREADALVPVTLFGAVLAFEAASYFEGSTFPWLRFYIMSIPLAIISVGMIVSSSSQARTAPEVEVPLVSPLAAALRRSSRRRWVRILGVLGAVALIAPAMVTTFSGMMNSSVGFEESPLASILEPGSHPPSRQPDFGNYQAIRTATEWLDHQHLPAGSVLVDTFLGWPFFLFSSNPTQFTVTSDLDFVSRLNAPYLSGVKYILVPSSQALGHLDAVNRRYPLLWLTGAGIARLAYVIPRSGGTPPWRLFQVIRPTSNPDSAATPA